MIKHQKLKNENEIGKWIEPYLNDGENVLWHGKPRILRYVLSHPSLKYILPFYFLGIIALFIISYNGITTEGWELVDAIIGTMIFTVFILLTIPVVFMLQDQNQDISPLWAALYCVTDQRVLIFSHEQGNIRHEYGQETNTIHVRLYGRNRNIGDIIFETQYPPKRTQESPQRKITIGFKGISNINRVTELVSQTLNATVKYDNPPKNKKEKAR